MNSPYFSADEDQDALVITFLDRRLLEENVEAMRGDMLRAIERRRNVVLDLAQVEFLASAALGLIVQIGQKVSRLGGKLVLCQIRPEISRLFTGPPYLMRNFPVYDNREAALQALKNGS